MNGSDTSSKLKRFFFSILVDTELRLSGSFVCKESNIQKKMMSMTEEYSRKFTQDKNITFMVTYISEVRKVKDFVYSDGKEDNHVNIRRNGGFVYSILKIMENDDNVIIGINQK